MFTFTLILIATIVTEDTTVGTDGIVGILLEIIMATEIIIIRPITIMEMVVMDIMDLTAIITTVADSVDLEIVMEEATDQTHTADHLGVTHMDLLPQGLVLQIKTCITVHEEMEQVLLRAVLQERIEII